MKFVLALSAFTLTAPSFAYAYTVYPGCAAPTLKSSHHTFYIDPIHGSQSGDGSAGKPWHTLAEVLDTSNKLLSTMAHNSRTFKNGDSSLSIVNPNAPVKPGDVLMLMSGNHGDAKILNSFNHDFITVTAAPGQKPQLSSLSVVSSGKWLFEGISFTGLNPNPQSNPKGAITSLVSIGRGDWIGTTSDILLDSSSLSSTTDTASWSASDWNSKPYYYLLLLNAGAKCLAATNNNLTNGLDGIALGAANSVVQSNVITRMRYDGIDFYGSNEMIKQNTIKDGTNDFATDILHPDGIQGWSLSSNGAVMTNLNDVIDGNTVIKTGDGDVTQQQGISIFDGEWNNLQIINNVVISNVWNGIAVYGGQNVSIINNTVLASDPKYTTWIYAGKSKTGIAGNNVVIRNNITSNLQIGEPNVKYDHNMIVSTVQEKTSDNKTVVTTKGTVGNSNKILSSLSDGFFSADASTGSYDLRLRPSSAAIGAGASSGAPLSDIVNKRRSNPFDVGAFEH